MEKNSYKKVKLNGDKTIAIIATTFIALVLLFSTLTLVTSTTEAQEIDPLPNPELSSSCGIDMVLILDVSGSISSTEFSDMVTAFNYFVDAFLPKTPTRMAVVHFADVEDAELKQTYTNNITAIKFAINNRTDSGSTYFAPALQVAYDEYLANSRTTKPDLFVFASDGVPSDITEAINLSNTIKSVGVRILTLGIGSGVNSDNLIAISSADAYYDTDFNTLADDLSTLANDLCGGTISVQKFVDGQPAAGWEFSASVTGGTADPISATTDESGFVLFTINISEGNETALVTITEESKSGYSFVSAQAINCSDIVVGSSSTGMISNIPVSKACAIYCMFNNTFQDDTDTTPPTQIIELGTPIIEDVYDTGLETLDLIGSQTPVWINSSDSESGTHYIQYKLFQSDTFGNWGDPPWVYVYDNQQTGNSLTSDTDPTVGRISIEMYIQESCFHQIHAHCVDNEGNWNYSDPYDFLVDYDAPSNDEFTYIDSYKLIGGARYINNQSIKRVYANDTGCTGGVAGVDRIIWRVENNKTQTIASGVVYDNNTTVYNDGKVMVSGDLDSTIGKMIIEFTLNEECVHFIYHQAVDALENAVIGRKELVYVDLTPPEINKTVGDPNCVIIDEKEYCITNKTPIMVTAEDKGCYGGVGLKSLDYRIWNQSYGWANWADLICCPTIYFDEECTHYLEIRAIDRLGNMVIDNETFHVDMQPPLIEKTVGNPHCGPEWENISSVPIDYQNYFSEGIEAYCIRTNTSITLNATDLGCCTSAITIEYKYWRVNETEPTSWVTYTGPFTISKECQHYLLIRAYDCLGYGMDDPNYWDLEIFYVDDQAPLINKTIGDPHCMIIDGSEYCVTTMTPIVIEAEHQGCCPDEYLMLRYKINDDDWITPMLPEIVTFEEECTHTLTIEAWDCLGNKVTDVETFHVDDTAPDLEKIVGDPNCPVEMDCTMLSIPNATIQMVFQHTENPCYFNIQLYNVPMGYDIINGDYYGWCVDRDHTITDDIVYSGEIWCPYDPEIPWPDDDWDKVNYIINHKHPNATMMDVQDAIWYFVNGGHTPSTLVGKSMVENATLYGEGFIPLQGQYCALLLDSGNRTQKAIIEFKVPESYCVTTNTNITLSATDRPACCQQDIIVEYKMWQANESMPENWTVYNGPFNFNEECKHYLLVRVYDCLGNGMDDPTWDLEIFYVDETPPVINKTVGDPQCEIIPNQEYCITTETPINIDAWNMGCCEDDYLGIRYQINDQGWIEITDLPAKIYIDEECVHNLTIEAWDCLGNNVTDIQTFYVQDTPPRILKTIGEPYCGPEIEGNESIPEWYRQYFTSVEVYCVNFSTQITLEGLPALGCCQSNITLEYKMWPATYDEPKLWTHYNGSISFKEECKHFLLVRAYDCLENGKYNISLWDLEIFYVDETPPPKPEKIVGDPKVRLEEDTSGHDQWMIFPETDICFTEFGDEGCCPNQSVTIEYRYWYLGEWTEWMTYTECIHLTQGCVHYLEARAIDCLGNSGPVDNETFWVCGPGDSGPDIVIREPGFGEEICDPRIEVIIDASDDETEKENLNVVLWIPGGRRDAPTFYYYPEYDPNKYGDEYFHAFIDIYKYQDGADLTLQAIAQDEDMNTEITTPTQFKVCSTVVWDQWMQKGWNRLVIPFGGISCNSSVEHALASIYDYVDGIFHHDGTSWSSYIPDEPWNPWEELQTGKTYWVYITKEDGLRYYTDTHAPAVSIEYPQDEAFIGCEGFQMDIWGNALDIETGIKEVMITVYDNNTGNYWNGTNWGAYTELECFYNESIHQWAYMGTNAIMLEGNRSITITAYCTDMAGCMVMDMINIDYECIIGETSINTVKKVWNPVTYEALDNYVTYLYTVADIVIFGYENETNVTIYDEFDSLVWNGQVDDGEYHHEKVSKGVYKLVGDKKFAVLIGDPITSRVLGYYAVDNNGYGLGTKLYTYFPSGFSTDAFIVFSYTDGTEVTITNLDTDTEIWNGTLNTGEHYTNTNLGDVFLLVESNYPVSALTYNDQGYFIPSADKTFSGTEFYTYTDYVGSWQNSLWVMAYDDATHVNITNTDTDVVYFDGMIDAGENFHITSSESRYYTIKTDKDVTCANLPIDGWSSGYAHGTYVADRTGSGIGTEFYSPSLSGGELLVFAYENSTKVHVYDAETGVLNNIYELNQSESVNVNPGYGYWHITSDRRVSVYEGYASASASFAPVLFGEAAGGFWADSRQADVGETVLFRIGVQNDGDITLTNWNITDTLPQGLDYIEESCTMTFGGTVVNHTHAQPQSITTQNGNTNLSWWETGFEEQSFDANTWIYIEFEATVTVCNDTGFVNNAVATATPPVNDSDIATVYVPCEECLNIVEMAVSQAPEFTMLVDAVVAAGLDGVLSNLSNEFTVFAPVNAAFDLLDPVVLADLVNNDTGNLTEILTYHVVPGTYLSTDLSDGMELTTVQGEDILITVNGSGVFVNDAQVVVADVVCCNGVIHAIDEVLLPPEPEPCLNIVEMAVSQAPEFTTLVDAVVNASLVDVLSNLSNEFTVFAPVNTGFDELDQVVLRDLLENDTVNLTEILTYHVVPGTYLSTDLSDGMELETVQGENVSITVNGSGVFVNDAKVMLADVVCCNGVIHAIDKVLLPPDCIPAATISFPYYEPIDGDVTLTIKGNVYDECACVDPSNVSIAIYFTNSSDGLTYYWNATSGVWEPPTIQYNPIVDYSGGCPDNTMNFNYTIPSSFYNEGATTYYIHVAAHPDLQNNDVVTSEFTVGIPAVDFVGYWQFDEGSGTTVADTADSADGMVVGGPNWTTGKLGNALEFDESGEYVQLYNSMGVNFSGDYTWMAWVQAPTEATSTVEHKIMGRIPFDNLEAIQLHTGHGVYGYPNKLYHNIYAGSSDFRSTTDVRDDQWHFVVAVNTGSQIKIYVDEGVPEVTQAYSGAAVSTKDMSIGSFMGSQVFNGLIDEVAIFDRALNDEEVHQCYRNIIAGLNYIGE